jgi:hypothetical protein
MQKNLLAERYGSDHAAVELLGTCAEDLQSGLAELILDTP